MEQIAEATRALCHRCQRPADLEDRRGVPFCLRHAIVGSARQRADERTRERPRPG